jgi:predicted Rossmann fold flavoprotein
MAALFASRAGATVTLYEHNSDVGKKILASGNGRCNIINTTATCDDYAGQNPSFASYALKQLSFGYFVTLCRSLGLELDIKEDGRCYPLSNEAKSVVLALKNSVQNLGVDINCEETVNAITYHGNNFTVNTNKTKHQFDKVVIATGSQAAPQLGSTADGYTFAKHFGHRIVPPYPSLVQLELNSKIHAKMAGVKTVATVELIVNNKTVQNVSGDILFTAYGISGLAILDISQKASLALLNKQRVSIALNLLPRYNSDELEEVLRTLLKALPSQPLSSALSGILPSKTISPLLDTLGVNPNKQNMTLTSQEIAKILYTIQNWKFEVSGTHGFKHAEVSGGGVDTSQINPKTMESQLRKGLYFTGEVLDIVGKRGGYNFHFAWASGMIAGREMGKS